MQASSETQATAPSALPEQDVQTKGAPPASSEADPAPAKKEERPAASADRRQRQRRARGKSGSRKDGAANDTAKKGGQADAGSKTPGRDGGARPRYQRRNERRSNERGETPTENLSNVLTIGMRLHIVQYVRIIKNVLNLDKHEEIELHGYGQGGMARLTQVVNILSTWGYIHVTKIKTRSEPGLKIVVRRTADFQKHYDAFALKTQERREERERIRAEKKAEQDSAAEAAKADDEADPADSASKME